jgi:hypothetical protein
MNEIGIPKHVEKFANEFLKYLAGPNQYVTEEYWQTQVYPEQHECYLKIKDELTQPLEKLKQNPDDRALRENLFLRVCLYKLNEMKDKPVSRGSNTVTLKFDWGWSIYEAYSPNKTLDEVMREIEQMMINQHLGIL